jgi:DNA-binding XRE family transcriptional regulator
LKTSLFAAVHSRTAREINRRREGLFQRIASQLPTVMPVDFRSDCGANSVQEPTMPVLKPSPEDLKRRAFLALEFKSFRRKFLFSQQNLADHLSCSRRTVVSIEGGVTMYPHPRLLRAFRDLKRAEAVRVA